MAETSGPANATLQLLLVEDHPDFAKIIADLLSESKSPPIKIHWSENLSLSLDYLRDHPVDIILLDLSLPDSYGLGAIPEIRTRAPGIPIVVFTADDEESSAIQALRQGAQDYVLKENFDANSLGKSIRYAIERHNLLLKLEQTVENLRKVQQNLRNVIERNNDGVIVMSQDRTIRFVNEAFELLLQKRSEEILGQRFEYDFAVNEKKEIKIGRKNGNSKMVELQATDAEWESEECILVTIHDVTEHWLAEDRLRKLNEELKRVDGLKSNFVSVVSHELRTPLTVIISSVCNLLEGVFGTLTEQQQKWIDKIGKHAARLNELISDILDLSKLESGKTEMKKEPLEMGSLVETVVANMQSLATAKSLKLSVQLENPLPPVPVNRGRIEQVLTNLIGNAIKFTPTDGKIKVKVAAQKHLIRVTVSDSGPGIPKQHLDQIFERFEQIRNDQDVGRSIKGIGLGLAICKEIIAQHAGRIWAESEPGQGSHFIFLLPLGASLNVYDESKSILILDDDEEICELLGLTLKKWGHQVIVCQNGDEAIQRIQGSSHRFDLAFLDLMLPGKSGVDVVKTFRETSPETQIAIITAYPNSKALFETMKFVPLTIIAKPFNPEHIQDTIKRCPRRA